MTENPEQHFVFNPFGGSFYTHSEESRAAWQLLIDRSMEKLLAVAKERALRNPAPPHSPIIAQYIGENLFAGAVKTGRHLPGL